MKKKLLCLILAALMVLSIMPASAFAQTQRNLYREESVAKELKALNLFKGVSATNFDLGRAPSRIEALVIMLRLLGKESEILAGNYTHPFTDVDEWANKYVGYAYENGLTKGVSVTKFGSGNASASQFMTFVLRAMGYSDAEGDFAWDNPFTLATQIGIMEDNIKIDSGFWRADCGSICFNALGAKLKSGNKTLADKLIDEKVFTKAAYDTAVKKISELPKQPPKETFDNLLTDVWNSRTTSYTNASLKKAAEKYIPDDPSAKNLISAEELSKLRDNSNPGKETITKEEAKADIDLFFRVLHSSYVAYYYFGEENFKQAESNLIAWVDKQTGPIKSENLQAQMRQETEFMKDGHGTVGVSYVNAFGRINSFISYQYRFEKDALGYYTVIDKVKYYVTNIPSGVAINRALFDNGEIAYAPTARGKGDTFNNTSLALKAADGKTKSISISWTKLLSYDSRNTESISSYFNKNGIAYISIRAFMESRYPDEFARFIASGKEVKNSKLIIFDLRANMGGDGESLDAWTKNFTGKVIAPVQLFAHRCTPLAGSPDFLHGWFDTNITCPAVSAKDNEIPIIVLVDNNTLSAGEYAAQVLKEFKNAIVIGTNTQGTQFAGELHGIKLPNSGISATVGGCMRLVKGLDNHDLVGDDPDVWCNGKDTLISVLKMIERYDLADTNAVDALKAFLQNTVSDYSAKRR
ncbi:MAG: S41 family peptidase [Bacillota bacterium]|nr:S41 family peptidase [Bacillota bacterium]